MVGKISRVGTGGPLLPFSPPTMRIEPFESIIAEGYQRGSCVRRHMSLAFIAFMDDLIYLQPENAEVLLPIVCTVDTGFTVGKVEPHAIE